MRDHRLAGVVAAVVAHLRGARAMAERAQVVRRRTSGGCAALRVSSSIRTSRRTPSPPSPISPARCASQLPRLSGVPVRTSVPSLAKRSFMSAVLRTRTSSRVQLRDDLARDAGRADDALERAGLESGQALLGDRRRIGRRGTRCALEIASARSLPPCHRRPGGEHAVEQHVRLARRRLPATASEPPLYGM